MKRSLILLILACAVQSACKKDEPSADPAPTKETAAGVDLIDYAPPKGAFTCRAPGAWKAREDSASGTDSVTFIGPPSPNGSAYINILQYPHGKDDQWSDAEKYAKSFWEIDPANKQPVVEKTMIGGNAVIQFHQERPFRKVHSTRIEYMERHDYALIPVKGGFFEIWHSAPVHSYQETLPIFEAVVRSFKPK